MATPRAGLACGVGGFRGIRTFRRLLNPFSTSATPLWCHSALRRLLGLSSDQRQNLWDPMAPQGVQGCRRPRKLTAAPKPSVGAPLRTPVWFYARWQPGLNGAKRCRRWRPGRPPYWAPSPQAVEYSRGASNVCHYAASPPPSGAAPLRSISPLAGCVRLGLRRKRAPLRVHPSATSTARTRPSSARFAQRSRSLAIGPRR